MSSEKSSGGGLKEALRRFFFPPSDVSTFRRLAPYGLLGVLTLVLLGAGTYGWEYTNSPVFCGTSCHTMPPEYAAYQVSPHARVPCVDCHIGRDFITTRITRKAGDVRHIVKMTFSTYEYPIFADQLRPARETCEKCHYPSKFSDDSLRQVTRFAPDENNTRSTIYLALRTGGGSSRVGLGRGIHWHVENQVYFVATDDLEQNIPYVRVVGTDGTEEEFYALDTDLTPDEIAGMEEQQMDCITCHNRISHNIQPPERSVDLALARKQIDSDIPFIRYLGVSVLEGAYASDASGRAVVQELTDYYQTEFPDYYAENQETVDEAVQVLSGIYDNSVFHDQEIDWTTHPNNLGHKDWPGCFRCHDGQHLSEDGEAIRLECNLCHSIPEVAVEGTIEPTLPLATGLEPSSHFSTHWINQHRYSFDESCAACHTVDNPGGTDNSSFCSNSACHGTTWEFAGLDAPGLAERVAEAIPADDEPDVAEVGPGGPTWEDQIGPMLDKQCTACHSKALATGGLVLQDYNAAMTGSTNGPVIAPGAPDSSRIVEVQQGTHFANLSDADLNLLIEWIRLGAPQN